jgi:N-dimethylarginine dimethylaminohydrolase
VLCIQDEYSRLQRVIVGLGSPYQRDRERMLAELADFPFVPETARKAEVLDLAYPSEAILQREYADYVALLEKYGVEILRADPGAAYSFDYTCPRDIGFVVGDVFFIANMAVESRAEEIKTIAHHLRDIDAAKTVRPPNGCLLEGGDVIVLDRKTLLVGINQRSNREGYEFLRGFLTPRGFAVIPVRHTQLHLDCCLNPLGMGHLLIHPESLEGNDASTWQMLQGYDWIRVDAREREHLATNLLSVDPGTVIARDHESCRRVNRQLIAAGYSVETVGFDGVPATGGSFRCASLALRRLQA